jgi:hypothetical protein
LNKPRRESAYRTASWHPGTHIVDLLLASARQRLNADRSRAWTSAARVGLLDQLRKPRNKLGNAEP